MDLDQRQQHAAAGNNWRGNNRTRYTNPDFDAMINRYQTTIPLNERLEIFGDLLRFMTDQQLYIGLFYDVEADMVELQGSPELRSLGRGGLGSGRVRQVCFRGPLESQLT